MDIKGVKNKALINLCQDVRQYTLGSCTNLNLLNIVYCRRAAIGNLWMSHGNSGNFP